MSPRPGLHPRLASIVGDARRRPGRFLVLTTAVAAGVLGILGMLPPVGHADFRLDVHGTGAEFAVEMGQDLLDTPIGARSVTLQDMGSMELAGRSMADADRAELDGPESRRRMAERGVGDPTALAVDSPLLERVGPLRDGIQFGALSLGPDSRVRVSRAQDEEAVDLELVAGSWSGVVWLDSVRVRTFGGPDPINSLHGVTDAPAGLGESVNFTASKATAGGLRPRIRLRGGRAWRMTPNLAAHSFAFWDEEQGARSMVQTGMLRVNETIFGRPAGGVRIELIDGDKLGFDDAQGFVREMQVDDTISVRISGLAGGVALENREIRGSPLLLLYHWQPARVLAAVLIGAATILAGIEVIAPEGWLRIADE